MRKNVSVVERTFLKMNRNKKRKGYSDITSHMNNVSANDISVYDDLGMSESDTEDNQYSSFTIDHEPSYNAQSSISHDTQSLSDVSLNNTAYQNLYPDINNQVGNRFHVWITISYSNY